LNKREKEIFQLQLKAEEDILHELEKQYRAALKDIKKKIQIFEYDIFMIERAIRNNDMTDEERAIALSQRRSKIYQKNYQETLEHQLNAALDKLQSDEFATIQEYLHNSYIDAFLGTVYDIHGQGIPLIMPIDQAAAVKAIMTDSKINEGLYKALGVDVKKLKDSIRHEIARGIASGLSNDEMSRNISRMSKAPLSRAKVIVRTEAHRIQQASTMDAQERSKSMGANVVKQWDSTLDGRTRSEHRKLDGQIREIDEPFEAGGLKAMAPGHFGDPAHDCNCRCVSLTRARWALDEGELQTLKDRAKYYGLDKTEDFNDFKKKYLKASEQETV
jgi:SPP1 gp7 family putative phage head morphogenesis protein